ncbi:dual specificity protein phosphatase family protein [Arenicella xantha]|uniref:Dual specificity protein phosphatase-like protein n=1 Tax=Arenicella xantha TaxID=644221 RepID=A0A395JJA3_9GAMM|nr:dual specificity protein phosphatase family protein [Arenicella xantha]RBP48848.1 dual specificity protein phosphatase-like protein [Arenicella xantha]
MINFGRIEQDIFIGSAPQSNIDVGRLKAMKITAVLSLQSDQDLKDYKIAWSKLESEYRANAISVHRFPIMDFDETDLGNKLVDPVTQLHRLLSIGHRVYVHCNAGICRAPATVLGYLCHYRGLTIDQGLEYIRRNRPQANPYVRAVTKGLVTLENTAKR